MAADKSKGQALQDWIAKSVPRLHQKRGACENALLTRNARFSDGLLMPRINFFGYDTHYFGRKRLSKDRVPAAPAVVCRGGETLAVVVVEN
jgi:hypothetical protein